MAEVGLPEGVALRGPGGLAVALQRPWALREAGGKTLGAPPSPEGRVLTFTNPTLV